MFSEGRKQYEAQWYGLSKVTCYQPKKTDARHSQSPRPSIIKLRPHLRPQLTGYDSIIPVLMAGFTSEIHSYRACKSGFDEIERSHGNS